MLAGDSPADSLGDSLAESVGEGVSDGEALWDGCFDGLADGLARMPGRFLELPVALSEGARDASSDGSVGAADVAHGPGFWLVQATVRKRSWAWRLTVSTRLFDVGPGISTTMYLLPCVVTSASATPDPLTRWSMMPAASLRLLEVGLPFAVRVIRVPPLRSRPSSGFQLPPRATRP